MGAISLLRDLADPAAYPEPRPSRVELRATHLSWVFLTDREAWKVKRPVRYDFADFSTPERRKHFCEEEVRLNRRLAPDVYLGVEPIRRDARGCSFTGTGEVVDHAVRMRRLPDGASAAARVAEEDLDRLAALMARFYAAAEADRSPVQGVLRRNVEENFDEVRPYVGRFVPRETFDAVRARQEEFLAANGPRFDGRAAAGRVRDGHGDLRLEHVYFLPGGPVVIDAIEFNRRFRVGDAASDAAFLAMELEDRGLGRLGEGFLARFARETDDYDFYPLLDFYLGYRAWVRGKVACFVAADPSTPEAKARRKAEEAARLFALSRRFAGPRPGPPRMVAVGGLIGSGKSTLADALGRAAGLPVVSSDLVRKSLGGIAPEASGGPELYTPAFSDRVHAEILRRADAVLEAGRSVVLDATFLRRVRRDEARAAAGRRGAPYHYVETSCGEAEMRARLRAREGALSISDAREDLLDRMLRDREPEEGHLRIDTTRPVEEGVARIRAAVQV